MTEFEVLVLQHLSSHGEGLHRVEKKLDEHLAVHTFLTNVVKYGVTTIIGAIGAGAALWKLLTP